MRFSIVKSYYFNIKQGATCHSSEVYPATNGFSQENEARMKIDDRKLYSQLSLVSLIKKIVGECDSLALEEFHSNRTIFRFRSGEIRKMRFIEFINELRERVEKDKNLGRQAFEIAAIAYDLTLDKFCNLPGQSSSLLKVDRKDRLKRGSRSDCRLYFKACLDRISKSFRGKPPASQIEAEERAALCMQGLVRNHFHKSLLQARRDLNAFWSRYTWIVKGTITVWLPVFLKGHERGEWLEKNIIDPDPNREGEKQRVQEIINAKLVDETIKRVIDGTINLHNGGGSLWRKEDGDFGIVLGQIIADEKADNIDQLRHSIRNLGKKKLKRMIMRIFEDVNSQEYVDGKIAKDFGLSKATFSRFAGSRWPASKSTIPDLWVNTAKVLSKHEIFEEVAMKTGYFDMAKTISEINILKKLEPN
jgi:hypothetical protein